VVLCVAPPEEFTGDARVNLDRLPGQPPQRFDGGGARRRRSDRRRAARHGLRRPAPRRRGEAIDAVNVTGAPVVSVDVPSGVDASSGGVSGKAVRAAVTVTFHAAKPGLWIRPGKAHAGEVQTIDIGIPRGAPLAATIGLIAPSVLDGLPRRGGQSTKFSSGHVTRRGRLARADRGAADGRAREHARRGGVRDRVHPGIAAGRGCERRAARADDARPRRGTAGS